MRIEFGLIVFLLVFFSCSKDEPWKVDTDDIEIEFVSNNFSEAFFDQSKSLEELKQSYNFFLDNATSDSIWKVQRTDKNEIHIYQKSFEALGGIQKINASLEDVLQRMKYFLPETKTPEVWLYSSGLQAVYNPVLYSRADAKLFVATDGFLGVKSELYDSVKLYEYVRHDRYPESLKPLVARAIGEDVIPVKLRERAFVDRMVREGKKLVMADALAPKVHDSIKIGYTAEELNWAKSQEGNIWNYFIEGELIFSQDPKLVERFIDLAPNSKFYNDVDQDSPGRIGQWIGWQICRKYLEETGEEDLQKFILEDSRVIFQKSGYKPTSNLQFQAGKEPSSTGDYE